MAIVVDCDTQCNLIKGYHRNVSEVPGASTFSVEVHREVKQTVNPDVDNFVPLDKEEGYRIHLLAR